MFKKLSSIALMSLATIGLFPGNSWADTVLEKVARTGVLTVGTRLDLVPYAYVDADGKLVGYSMDVVELVRKQLEKELGKEVILQVVASEDGVNRLPSVLAREVDIVCDTVFSWERDQFVDFSLSYGISGTRLVSPKGSKLGSPESLAGKRIGVISGGTAEQIIKSLQPKAVVVPFKMAVEVVQAIKEGKVDAVAGDSVIMAGFLLQTNNTENYAITPPEPYARHGMACMVPENNSGFLDIVNRSIVTMMQGYLSGDAASVKMVDTWFGKKGIVPIPPDIIRPFFQTTIITREQIPLGK